MEKLGINWGLLIAQLFNVILVVWLLTMFLYRPVLNMLNERTRRIQDGLKEAEQVKQQLASAKQDYDAELARARQEAAGILAQAQERAKAQEAELVAQARQEADRIRNEAREQAVQERDQLLRDLKNQVADLVTMTATRVLGEELKSNHDKLIEESLASLGRQN
ncbi:MAG TPA: F0F1 ATP synthase subunit B [Roseiflexaceae bacterium]|nr:F0F1 ATP synthase subunit B [Roseiflexaceae bacterium]